MFKQFMNGGSLKSLMLFDAADDAKAARDNQRAELLKNNTVVADPPVEKKEEEVKEEDKEEDEDEEDDEKKEEDKDPNEGLTPEQIKEKEAAEKIAAKAKRKEDRVQKRINDIAAQRDAANAEIAKLKAQLEADPEKKLTEEEVETRAQAIADKKLKDKELADLQAAFDNDCERLRKDATKTDKDFDDKIADIAEQFGPIPSFMIGILADLTNGGETLAKIAADDDLAESIYKLKAKPAKMTQAILDVSNKLIADKKKPKKEISKVPDPITPINSRNVRETVITEKDTKPENMQDYVAKRRAQQEEMKKARGY